MKLVVSSTADCVTVPGRVLSRTLAQGERAANLQGVGPGHRRAAPHRARGSFPRGDWGSHSLRLNSFQSALGIETHKGEETEHFSGNVDTFLKLPCALLVGLIAPFL